MAELSDGYLNNSGKAVILMLTIVFDQYIMPRSAH